MALASFTCEQASILRPPSLYERFVRTAKAKRGAEVDMNAPEFENNDLEVLSQMVRARHVTIDRTSHLLKSDAPLTLADVPMLLSLIQCAPLSENKTLVENKSKLRRRAEGHMTLLAGLQEFGTVRVHPSAPSSVHEINYQVAPQPTHGRDAST